MLEELLNDLETRLYNENPYAIPFILKDKQAMGELHDLLSELLVYRAMEGKDKINEPLPDNLLGKATVRKKFGERECVTYDDALRHIERIFGEYNHKAFEHRKDGFPVIQFECKAEPTDYGTMTLNYNLEIRLPKQGK